MEPTKDLPFLTPVTFEKQEENSWYASVLQVANDYLSPLGWLSGYSGHTAVAETALDDHKVVICDMKTEEDRSFWTEAAKVASYVIFPLPLAAAAVKLYDRHRHEYHMRDGQANRAVDTENVKLLWQLMQSDAPMDQVGSDRCHAFHLFAKHGRYDWIEELLQYGFDADLPDVIGRTALHYAAEAGRDSIVELLLTHRAQPNAVDNSSRTALHLAAELGHWNVISSLGNHERLAVRVVDEDGETPLDIVRRCFEEVPTHVLDILEGR